MTTVVNMKFNSFDVYIGRGSPFGNPYKIGQDGTRKEVIELYWHYFLEKLNSDPAFRAQVLAFRGKILGCRCKPLPCHGDVIAEWLDNDV
jgi:hypothetical protein